MEIERGTIKVVWIPKNKSRICSKMFKDAKDADKFGKTKKDYIIFRMIKHKGVEYEWEILSYGEYKLYKDLLKVYSRGKLSKLFDAIEKNLGF